MIGALFIGLAGQALAMPSTTLAPPLPLTTPAPPRSSAPLGTPQALANLRSKLEVIAAVRSGDVGIAVLDPRTGQSVAVNGERRFPMASTVKVAIAAFYLAEVDLGRRSLSDMIPVDDRLRLRADGITFFAPHPGVTLSGANLIELMLTRSDNTATDVLLHALGGPARVEAWLERNRLADMRIDRTIAELLLDRRGARPAAGRTAAETLRRWDPVAPGSVGEADNDNEPRVPGVDQDPRDTATPLGFAQFLHRLHSTALLRPASRDFLLGVMRRCLTGANRLKGLLPPGTTVEHKTGTLAGITDDVGFIALPDGRRLIVTAFARGGTDRPALIARAARAAYDAFAAP